MPLLCHPESRYDGEIGDCLRFVSSPDVILDICR